MFIPWWAIILIIIIVVIIASAHTSSINNLSDRIGDLEDKLDNDKDLPDFGE